MVQRAYTAIHSTPPHWDVGPTFETLADAQEWCGDTDSGYEPVEVVCWIDDFSVVNYGVFMFRTDGNHEVSFVVAEESTDRAECGNEAYVGTQIMPRTELSELGISDRVCVDHGECLHHKDTCVLCAEAAGEDTPEMNIAIRIERAKRGTTAPSDEMDGN